MKMLREILGKYRKYKIGGETFERKIIFSIIFFVIFDLPRIFWTGH